LFHTLLINPFTPDKIENKEFRLPSSLLYLGAYLKDAEESVSITDLNTVRPWLYENPMQTAVDTLFADIRQTSPSLIGFSCMFTCQFEQVAALVRKVKEVFPDIPIVLGGMHPTIFPREILSGFGFIDYIVLGEGERQLLSLVNSLKNGLPLSDIQGFAYTKDGEVRINPRKDYIEDVDNLPIQGYGLVDLDKYVFDTKHWHNPKNDDIYISAPFITSRSCPVSCNFCSMHLVGGNKYRARTPENVVDEIEMLVKEYGIRRLEINDDNFTLNKKRTIEICNDIVRRGLDIQFETLNGLMVNTLTDEVVDALASAGWVRGALAIESGSEMIRNRVIGKNLSEKVIYDAIASIRRYDHIYLKAYFMIGLPEETTETLEETYKMISDLNLEDPYVTNVIPYPGTRLFEQCVRDGLFTDIIDLENLWKNSDYYMTNSDHFYIKPYSLSLETLREYRGRFDRLVKETYRKSKYQKGV